MMPATPWSSSDSTYSSSDMPPGDWVHSTGVKRRRASASSITCAKAGKIGFSSSGTTRPTRPALRWRSWRGSLVAEDVERGDDRLACVRSLTPGLELSTRLTPSPR